MRCFERPTEAPMMAAPFVAISVLLLYASARDSVAIPARLFPKNSLLFAAFGYDAGDVDAFAANIRKLLAVAGPAEEYLNRARSY